MKTPAPNAIVNILTLHPHLVPLTAPHNVRVRQADVNVFSVFTVEGDRDQ